MRRKLKIKADHKEHEKRVVKRYAWFPKTLDDDYFVWLEHYYIQQTYWIYNRKGRWHDRDTWSESTEKKRFLESIKDSENVQDRMDSPTYSLAKQAARRALRKRNSTYQ
jgi:hypothetical protein